MMWSFHINTAGSDRVPMTMITHHDKGTRFAAALEPVANGHKPEISTIDIAQTGNATLITVERGQESDVFTLTLDNTCTITSNENSVTLNTLSTQERRKN